MSLLVVAHSRLPLTRVGQLVSHFLAFRHRREGRAGIELDPVLGIWRDADPLGVATGLTSPDPADPSQGPWAGEFFGHEGEWYACRLLTDPGAQGEPETLVGLLNLLQDLPRTAGKQPAGRFSPCFPAGHSEAEAQALRSRLSTSFPGTVDRATFQDRETGRLRPVPDSPASGTG
jgi:hypothetical protein